MKLALPQLTSLRPRFTVRGLFAVMCLAAIASAWVANNRRRAAEDLAFMTNSDSRRGQTAIGVELLPAPRDFYSRHVLGPLGLGPQPFALTLYTYAWRTEDYDAADRERIQLVERLDSSSTIRIPTLTLSGVTKPSCVYASQWISQIEWLSISNTPLNGLPVDRMPRLRTLELHGCELTADLTRAAFPRLEAVTLANCGATEPSIAEAFRQSPRLRRITSKVKDDADPNGERPTNDTPLRWSDADAATLSLAARLEAVEFDSVELSSAGLASLARLPRLRRLTLVGKVSGDLDPLLAHARLEVLTLRGDLTGVAPPKTTRFGPKLIRIEHQGSQTPRAFEAMLSALCKQNGVTYTTTP